MINISYWSRQLVGANVLFLLHLSYYEYTFIRIRNVCFSYRKSGVVGIVFPGYWMEKSGVTCFFENILKKCGIVWFFRELFFKKWRYVNIPGKCWKKWSYSIFPCVSLRLRVHFRKFKNLFWKTHHLCGFSGKPQIYYISNTGRICRIIRRPSIPCDSGHWLILYTLITSAEVT